MSRNTQYQFVDTDATKLVASLVAAYEKITGVSVRPASPEKLFIGWVASIILQERVINNYTGNQNIPSRAEGENLDALGELFYVTERPAAKPAACIERFHISAPQQTAVLIPAGTRVTDSSNTLVWETEADAYIPAGETSADLPVKCQTAGTAGNGYALGQINTVIDLFDYYDRCENITVSDSGADRASDDEYYALMRASMDGYSTAGAKGGYVYFAKKVSTEIADVVANCPAPGHVSIYVLMADGKIAAEEMKRDVLAACTPDTVRPLTDYVTVDDPETVPYDIELTYYIPRDTAVSAAEIQAAVEGAVARFTAWQSGRLGRDINPSHLIGLLMQTGIKRVALTSPAYTALRDGGADNVPQVAAVRTVSVRSGGYEDG